MTLLKHIFTFSFFIYSVSFAQAGWEKIAAELSEKKLKFGKVPPSADLSAFEETGRLDNYDTRKRDHHTTESPFGVYGLQKIENNEYVALHLIDPAFEVGHSLVAEAAATDVLTKYQGHAYGPLLQKATLQHLQPFIEGSTQFNATAPTTLSYIKGLDEWWGGTNHPALSSTTKAGYGIIGLTNTTSPNVLVKYPAQNTWDEKKTTNLLSASRQLYTLHLKEQSLKDLATPEMQLIVTPLIQILSGLSLNKREDLISFIGISNLLFDRLGKESSIWIEVKPLIQKFSEDIFCKMQKHLLGQETVDDRANDSYPYPMCSPELSQLFSSLRQ